MAEVDQSCDASDGEKFKVTRPSDKVKMENGNYCRGAGEFIRSRK